MIKIIQHLFVYPVKSLGGCELSETRLTSRGLAYDRRMMLIDENGKFLTQREVPEMAFFSTEMAGKELKIAARSEMGTEEICVLLDPAHGKEVNVEVWTDQCVALEVSDEANTFFSEKFKKGIRLVYMPEDSFRLVDDRYNIDNALTAFTDGYPILMIGSASLIDLNVRLRKNGYLKEMGWDRFRPNIVVNTIEPFEEDLWKKFVIGKLQFEVVKHCSRCVMTTIDQQTGIKNKEPLFTLSQFRNTENKVLFGQNVIGKSKDGVLRVGDSLSEENKINEES